MRWRLGLKWDFAERKTGDLAPSLTELEDGGASRIGHGNTVVRVVSVAEGWAGEEEVAHDPQPEPLVAMNCESGGALRELPSVSGVGRGEGGVPLGCE